MNVAMVTRTYTAKYLPFFQTALAEGTCNLECIARFRCRSQFSLETIKKAVPRLFFEKWSKLLDNTEIKGVSTSVH